MYQREYCSLMFVLKISSSPEHPCKTVLQNESATVLFPKCPSLPVPFSLRVTKLVSDNRIPLSEIYSEDLRRLAQLWNICLIRCDASFTQVNANFAPTAAIAQHFVSLKHVTEFYVDALKAKDWVFAAAVGPEFSYARRSNGRWSLFTAEAYTTSMAVKHTRKVHAQIGSVQWLPERCVSATHM